MNDNDSGSGGGLRQEQPSSGTSAGAASRGGRRSSMNDAVKPSGAATSTNASGRPGRRSSYTNRRGSFGTSAIPPPPGSSSVNVSANASANRRASQDSAMSSSSYNRRGSQTSHNNGSQGRIGMLREEIAQLKEAAERELREREGDIHALRVEKAGYEEKQRGMESEMHEHLERQQRETEEKKRKEEAERKAKQKQPQERRRSGLLQRRPSLNSLSSWGAMAKMDNENIDDSSSDEEKGGSRTALSRRSSSASLAALAVLSESLNGGLDYKDDRVGESEKQTAADGAGDELPRSIEVSPRRASLHDSLANLGGGIQREQMRRRPSLSSLVGWARDDQGMEDHAADVAPTVPAEDNQSFGRISRRNSFGSLSAMSMGLSSSDLDGDSSDQYDDIGSAAQTLTSDDKTSSVGRLGGMHKASSMRSVASNLDIESMRSKLQRRSSDRGVTSSNVAAISRRRSTEDIPLSSLAAFDGMKKSATERRRSLEEIPSSSLGGSDGMSRVRSASALSALADMLDNDNDGDDCDRSIGAHSAGPLMTLRLNDEEDGGRRKQEKGKMKRRGSFGGLGGALANLGIGGGDDDRSIGGHSLGAMVFAAEKNGKAQRRPSLGSLQLFGHAKASWSKEQADQLLKEGGGSMKRSSSFSALSNMADGPHDSDSDIGDRSVGAHSLGPFMLGSELRRGEESGGGQMKRRPSLGALGLFGQANWSKEQADKMVEESTKKKMQREREERIKRIREERQTQYDEQVNELKSSMEAAEKRKDALRQASKDQEEQIALLRLQVRAAKAKREGKLSAKRRESIGEAAPDVSEVNPEEQQRQLKEIQEKIEEERASWSTISEKLDEADANVDSLEKLLRRMKRKAIEALHQEASEDAPSPIDTSTPEEISIDISWDTVPDLLAIAITVWDRVVRESDTERTRAKARHRIIATCSYRLAKGLSQSLVDNMPSDCDGNGDMDERKRCPVDNRIAEGIASTTRALESSATSLQQDTNRTKLALTSTHTAKSISEKVILRDISLFRITKSILNLCQSVALSSSDNGDVRSRLLSDYTSFRCDRSGLAISSKLQERLEVLRCRSDDRDLTMRSLERKKEQMEAKVSALKQSIGKTTIDIIERKQYFMLAMASVKHKSKPMQETLRMQQLQIQSLTHDMSEYDKKIQLLEVELRKLRGMTRKV